MLLKRKEKRGGKEIMNFKSRIFHYRIFPLLARGGRERGEELIIYASRKINEVTMKKERGKGRGGDKFPNLIPISLHLIMAGPLKRK